MSEAKKTPAEVWKILPLKHKIISVVVAIVVASFSAFGVYYAVTGEFPKLGFGGLTPARDLTGTWRNPISGQGLIQWGTYPRGPSDLYPSGPNPEDAHYVRYWDIELKLKQSGNTIDGYMTYTLVKASQPKPAPRNTEEVIYIPEPLPVEPDLTKPHTTYVTGTVEGTKITINTWMYDTPLTGTFTTDFMTLAGQRPGEYEAFVIGYNVLVDWRYKLSLSRVW